MNKLLAIASIGEAAVGIFFLILPSIAIYLLLGSEDMGLGIEMGRFFGIGLISLAVACWTGNSLYYLSALRGMLLYNLLAALFIIYLGISGFNGLFLWPAAFLHSVLAILFTWQLRSSLS